MYPFWGAAVSKRRLEHCHTFQARSYIWFRSNTKQCSSWRGNSDNLWLQSLKALFLLTILQKYVTHGQRKKMRCPLRFVKFLQWKTPLLLLLVRAESVGKLAVRWKRFRLANFNSYCENIYWTSCKYKNHQEKKRFTKLEPPRTKTFRRFMFQSIEASSWLQITIKNMIDQCAWGMHGGSTLK